MVRLHGSYLHIKISNKFNRRITKLVRKVTPARSSWKIKSTVRNLEIGMLERYCNQFNYRNHYFHAYAKHIYHQKFTHKLYDRRPYADLYFYTINDDVLIPDISSKQFRQQQNKQLHQDFNQVFTNYHHKLIKYVYTDSYFKQNNDNNKQIKQLRHELKQDTNRKDDNMITRNTGNIAFEIRIDNHLNHMIRTTIKHKYPDKNINHLVYDLERRTLQYYCVHFNDRNSDIKSRAYVTTSNTLAKLSHNSNRPIMIICCYIPDDHILHFTDFHIQQKKQLNQDFNQVFKNYQKGDE